MVDVKAEHPSLEGYLRATLNPEERASLFLPSFTQWSFSLAALTEIALAARSVGSDVTFGFWGDETPLPDVGWMSDRWVARLTGSRTRDSWAQRALMKAEFSRNDFIPPPVRHWKPIAPLPADLPTSRSGIRSLTYRDSPMGRAILQLRPDHAVPVTDEYRWPQPWLARSIRSYAFVYDQVDEAIRRRGITAVAVSNGRFLHDRAAAEAAIAGGVAVLYYDYGGADTAFDLTRDKTHDWAALQVRMRDMYSAWDPHERDVIGLSWFAGRREHSDSANSAFTDAQVRGRGIEVPDGKRLVVFFSSSGDEFAEFELDWNEYFGGQPQALLALSQACRDDADVFFVVRSHPHKRRKATRDVEDWHAAVEAAKPDLHVDEWSDVDSYELMTMADLVVTYGSTTGVEAASLGRPVMVMGPSAYDEVGCAIRPRNLEDVRQVVGAPVSGDLAGAISFGLMMKRRGFNLSRLRRDERGNFSLGGVVFAEPNQVSRKIADRLHRRHRRQISDGLW